MPESSTAMSATTPPPGTGPALVDLSQEAAAAPWEWGLVALAVLLALAFLWRSYFGRRKPACASCGKTGSCPVADAADEIGKPT